MIYLRFAVPVDVEPPVADALIARALTLRRHQGGALGFLRDPLVAQVLGRGVAGDLLGYSVDGLSVSALTGAHGGAPLTNTHHRTGTVC